MEDIIFELIGRLTVFVFIIAFCFLIFRFTLLHFYENVAISLTDKIKITSFWIVMLCFIFLGLKFINSFDNKDFSAKLNLSNVRLQGIDIASENNNLEIFSNMLKDAKPGEFTFIEPDFNMNKFN
jgi:hypothetical protein